MYICPILHFKVCDGQYQRNGQTYHGLLDENITGHCLHCPECDVHLTSLLLCPDCGTRYEVIAVTKSKEASRES